MKFNKLLLAIPLTLGLSYYNAQEVAAAEKIHVITMPDTGTDAIIIESDGHFGMIDTGEDPQYPDGSDPQYPSRYGIEKRANIDIRDRLFTHLQTIGVKKLDFLLITHTHSDHLGNAPELLNRIPTDKLLIKEYKDDYILDKNRLWDNQYGYDRTIQAAKDNQVDIINQITPEDAHFTLGNMDFQLYNYTSKDAATDERIHYYDDNLNSILTVIEINGNRLFFGGDLENTVGQEDYYGPIIGHVDLMKFNHHVDMENSNTPEFIDHLSPQFMLKTSNRELPESGKQLLKERNIQLLSAGQQDRVAIVVDVEGRIHNVSDNYPHYGATKYYNHLTFIDWSGKKITTPGWLLHNDSWYYIHPNTYLATGFTDISNHKYYFDDLGVMKVGEQDIDHHNYYFRSNGWMETGWAYNNDAWYYYDDNGIRLNGPQEINGKEYYFDHNGRQQTGWLTKDDEKYFYTQSGNPAKGWETDGLDWYYFGEDHTLKTGWFTYPNQRKSYLQEDGKMLHGWLEDRGDWYYFNSNGYNEIGWVSMNGTWYQFDQEGKLMHGWHQDSNNRYYYLQNSGSITFGWQEINGKWYHFNDSGLAEIAWFQQGDNWYYFDENARMLTGKQTINDQEYEFEETGVMK